MTMFDQIIVLQAAEEVARKSSLQGRYPYQDLTVANVL